MRQMRALSIQPWKSSDIKFYNFNCYFGRFSISYKEWNKRNIYSQGAWCAAKASSNFWWTLFLLENDNYPKRLIFMMRRNRLFIFSYKILNHRIFSAGFWCEIIIFRSLICFKLKEFLSTQNQLMRNLSQIYTFSQEHFKALKRYLFYMAFPRKSILKSWNGLI